MKSEKVWKMVAISVALLMVASVAGAVNQTGNSLNDAENKALDSDGTSSADASSVPICKHPKMSTEVAEMIPPSGIAPPAKQVIVNIYLADDSEAYIEELKDYTIEILYVKGNRIVAEIYTSEILEIVDLPFVTYMDTPLKAQLFPEVTVSESGEIYKHPKMSTEVTKNIPPPGIAPPAKPMIVNVYLKENETEKIKELENYTIEILYVKESRVVAEIYTSEILEIVDLPFVSYMDTPLKAQLSQIESEGLKCVNASELHNRGITGKGVKVAIVDLGFDGYEDLLGTELPADVTVMSFREDGDITGDGEIHGTGCAEIVHDVALDAELYLVNYKYVYQLEAISDYLISEDVDVVSHSAGHCVGLFDGTDYSCTIIDDAVFNHNITWVNAAGNYAQMHWEGMFTDTDSNGWHEYPCDGGELGQTITATAGDTVVVFLSWNDTWGYATQDYDLYIFNFENNWRIASKNPQSGSVGQKPVEGGGFVAPYTGTYYTAIGNSGATRPVHFELYSYTHDFGCKVENSSLFVEATAFGAIAVGAVNWEDCSTLHSYSSRGPTNDGREKPEVVGPACVSTQSYLSMGYSFCGTSAATPHIAGAIALELSSK